MNGNKWREHWSAFVLRGWRPCFWLGVAIFFLYAKTLAFRLTCFDDDILLGENFSILKNAGNLLSLFSKDVFMQSPQQMLYYRPILTLSFLVDAQLHGFSLFSFHLTNILLHIAASWLVFAVLQQLRIPRKRALILTLLFAVHPVLTQAVAWIPGRNDSLMAVFFLASFWAFQRYLEAFRKRDFLLHLFFLFSAVLTKESAFTLLPLGILYYAMFRRRDSEGKKILPVFAGWTAVLLLWVGMRSIVAKMPPQSLLVKLTFSSVLEKLMVFVQYVGKALLPFNLSGFPTLEDTTMIYGVIAVFLLAGAVLIQRKEYREQAYFGLAWFFVALAPLFLVQEPFWMEHRLYVPLFGILLVIAGIEKQNFGRFHRAFVPVSIAVILLFAGITFVHSDIFMNRKAFWESAVRASPHSSRAHGMLAIQYLELNEHDACEREITASLRLKPDDTSTYVNYGILLTEREQWQKAEQAFTAALHYYPGNWTAYYNYGMLCYLRGRDREAEICWRKAIEINPDYKLAYKTLAVYCYAKGDESKARQLGDKLRQKFGYTLVVPGKSVLKERKEFFSFGKYL